MNKHPRKDGIDPVLRSRARRRALQAVYAWQMSGAGVREVIAQFAHEQAREQADLEYFEDLVRGVDANQDALDEALAPFLDRDIDQVDPVERAVLRLAAYELRMRPDVPYRVVINEAIETAKKFGVEHAVDVGMAVLDRAAAEWRAPEVQAARRPR